MRSIIILVSVLMFSCETDRYVCNCEEKEKVTEFLNKNISASNNMSDEEMEDVIIELKRTAVEINCQLKSVYLNLDDNKLDSCDIIIWGIMPSSD